MKKHIILVALIVLGISSVAKAQIKHLTSDEFYAVTGRAFRLSSDRTRRVITKNEEFENGAIVASTIKTEEEILPDKSRLLIVERKGNVENTIETIVIGSKIYDRKNNGQWTIREMGNGDGRGAGFASVSCMQYTEEESSVDGVLARKTSRLNIKKDGNVLIFSDNSVWIDQQGYFLRSESIRGFVEPRVETYRSLTTYEYDPKDLKIEAPIK